MGEGDWLESFVFQKVSEGEFAWSKKPLSHWVGAGTGRWSTCTWFELDSMFLPFQIVVKHKTVVTQFSLALVVLTWALLEPVQGPGTTQHSLPVCPAVLSGVLLCSASACPPLRLLQPHPVLGWRRKGGVFVRPDIYRH